MSDAFDNVDPNEEISDSIYPVLCPDCGWFGMSDDCLYLLCPDCKSRVVKDKRHQ
jgi:hypothetical protein